MIDGRSNQERFRTWSTDAITRGSFGHGVPPQITKSQYDVPLPSVEVLVTEPRATSQHIRAAHCHIALCRLTEILGELLPLVYQLQSRSARETSKRLRHIRTDLDTWEESLPEWLRPPMEDSEPTIAGTCSLHLAFLAVKMLVCRVELQVRRLDFLVTGISGGLTLATGGQQFGERESRSAPILSDGASQGSRGDCPLHVHVAES